MGSVFSCKLNPCCGNLRDCTPPAQYYEAVTRAEASTEPPPFDPMQGCQHCHWDETNLGRVLDRKCDLHQKIEDVQVDAAMDSQVLRSLQGVMRELCEVIGADDDDDPVQVAKGRMEEISELEANADQAQKCIEALNICIKHDDRIEAALKVKVTRLEELLTDVQFMLDDNQSAGTIMRHIAAALKDIPDA